MTDAEFSRIVTFVKDGYGINLEKKRELIESRLSFHLSQLGYSSYTQYLNKVISAPDGDECRVMIDRLSTNHTYFFREMDAVNNFIGEAVPEILRRHPEKDIKIWCAAASSGQECWTIAMELESYLSVHSPMSRYSILATDISCRSLDSGEKGLYPVAELEKIPAEYRNTYTCVSGGNTFSIAQKLRNRVQWQRINLIDNFVFKDPFDVIFCRNVMFYFDKETLRALMPKLSMALCPGGMLYVGVTESIDRESQYFDFVAPSIYRRKGKA